MNEQKTESKKKISRREFITKSAMIGAGAAVGFNLIGLSKGPSAAFGATKKDLATGKIGGPTGFKGCERYQYGPDSSAGRAIEGLRKLRDAGKLPNKLVFMMPAATVGHWQKPYPEGAPTAEDLIKEETGLKLEIVGATYTDFPKMIIEDYQTGANEFDIYTCWASYELADIVASGAYLALDDFVEKYKPAWLDPDTGYVGGKSGFDSVNRVNGKIYNVNMDGDIRVHYYRKDLMNDPKEQKAFKERYGWDLQPAETWEQWDQLSEFFHRPDQGLLGNSEFVGFLWGFPQYCMRFASLAAPNMTYFDPETGAPNIYTPEGIQAMTEHLNAMQWRHADSAAWSWPEGYKLWAECGTALINSVPNLSKFTDSPGNKAHNNTFTALPPGRMHNDRLLRRSNQFPNVSHGVSSKTKYAEASYLLLQWASDQNISSWLIANPAGYYDPFLKSNFDDPVLEASYHPYQIPVCTETHKIATPGLNMPGSIEFFNSLETNRIDCITGRKTPEKACKDIQKIWNKIIKRIGKEKHQASVQASMTSWPKDTGSVPKIKS
jgi:multiple sugar transport system substrate-binding protein